MIIDTISNAAKYFPVHPLFEKAFAYINQTDLVQTEPGKYEIDGDKLFAIFSQKKGVTAAESKEKFECHYTYIDIQVCIKGHETFGWKPREKCANPKDFYDPDKDVMFFPDEPDMYFSLTGGQFVIFFPEDVHAPMIGDEEIRKVVIKVRKQV